MWGEGWLGDREVVRRRRHDLVRVAFRGEALQWVIFKVREHAGRRDCVVDWDNSHYYERRCGGLWRGGWCHAGVCAVSELAWREVKKVCELSGGFSPEACNFVREGLAHTVRMIHGDAAASAAPAPGDDSRHVNGQQLCLGLKDYAIKRYGLLARTVLGRWGIQRRQRRRACCGGVRACSGQ